MAETSMTSLPSSFALALRAPVFEPGGERGDIPSLGAPFGMLAKQVLQHHFERIWQTGNAGQLLSGERQDRDRGGDARFHRQSPFSL